MAKTTISVEITTPTGITIAEAVRLFTNHHNYQEQIPDENGEQIANPQTRAAFAKATVARLIRQAIKAEREKEAREAIEIGDDITVE